MSFRRTPWWMVSRKVFFEDEMLLVPSAVFHFIDNLVMYNVIPCENQFYSFMRCSVTSLQLAQVSTSAVKVDQKDKVKRMTLKTANGLFKLWISREWECGHVELFADVDQSCWFNPSFMGRVKRFFSGAIFNRNMISLFELTSFLLRNGSW